MPARNPDTLGRGLVYALAVGGYLCIDTGEWRTSDGTSFTSNYYEKVGLSK